MRRRSAIGLALVALFIGAFALVLVIILAFRIAGLQGDVAELRGRVSGLSETSLDLVKRADRLPIGEARP